MRGSVLAHWRHVFAGTLTVGALAAGIGSAGCDDTSAYSTAAGESYCGAVTLGAAFREGLSPRVQMRLELDAVRLDQQSSPGRVWMWEPPTQIEPRRVLLDTVALEPIAPLSHDALSDLDFGEGRERNAMFALRPDAPSAESMFAVLSLRSDGLVEIRLLRAGKRGDGVPEGQTPLYGVFLLERRRGDCG